MRRTALVAGLAVVVLLVIALPALVARGGQRAAEAIPPPAGFAGDVREAPRLGVWQATGTHTLVKGYGTRVTGEVITRNWRTSRECRSGACSYYLTRQLVAGDTTTARLELREDGWYATFPPRTSECHPGIAWTQQSAWVLRFEGAAARAHQVDVSYAPRCGYGTSRVDWRAQLVPGTGRPVGIDDPVPTGRGGAQRASERELAASVEEVVRFRVGEIETRISASIGQKVVLHVGQDRTTCRSPSGKGSHVVCIVDAMRSTGHDLTVLKVGILVTSIDGHCWRGAQYGYATRPGKPLERFGRRAIRTALAANPLRGCA